MSRTPVDGSPAWQALAGHADTIRSTTLRDLFAADGDRGTRLTAEAGELYLDYSKHLVTDETLMLLLQLAANAGVAERRDAMFAGEHINVTEDRAVLHTALRMPRDATLVVDGVDVVAEVHEVLGRMGAFADRVRGGEWTGATGERITTVVNIGIGGSDLGPSMAYEALLDVSQRDIACLFVSNVDGADIAEATRDLDPARTLFVISSKTFTTLETLTNAHSARHGAWPGSAATSRRWPSTSWRCRPTPPRWRSSGSTPTTCSSSGTGWAAATRTTPPSACRS